MIPKEIDNGKGLLRAELTSMIARKLSVQTHPMKSEDIKDKEG